jgi:hypothetical protein
MAKSTLREFGRPIIVSTKIVRYNIREKDLDKLFNGRHVAVLKEKSKNSVTLTGFRKDFMKSDRKISKLKSSYYNSKKLNLVLCDDKDGFYMFIRLPNPYARMDW